MALASAPIPFLHTEEVIYAWAHATWLTTKHPAEPGDSNRLANHAVL